MAPSAQLRLSRVVARTYELSASGAPRSIFPLHGFGQIHARDIRNRRQPSNNVGEFAQTFFVRTATKGRRQLAHLFHQPHKRAVDATSQILLEIHLANQLLEIGERDVAGTRVGRGRRFAGDEIGIIRWLGRGIHGARLSSND